MKIVDGLQSVVVTVAGRIMLPKDAHVLIPGTCDYVMLQGKEELREQMEARMLIS